MRIAVYHNLLSGGAKRTLFEAIKRLSRRHEIHAFSLTCSEHEFADIRPFVAEYRVFPFVPGRLLDSPFGRLNQAVRAVDLFRLQSVSQTIAREIDGGGYDVVYAHPCRFEQSPGILRFLTRTRSVYYCQEPLRLLYEAMPARPYGDEAIGRRRLLNRLDPLPGVYRGLLRRNDRANTRTSTSVLVNSRFMAGVVGRIYGIAPHVSYHGVDVDQFAPQGLSRRSFVLAVGSLTPLKGFDFLIRAMSHYPAGERPVLCVASNFQNPPERAYLDDLARQLGVRVEFSGTVRDADLVRLYNEAAAVVYAPYREPFGLVPVEAMSCGTPVVAVSEGGVAETIIDGRTGYLVERDPRAFAEAVQRVMRDPALARDLGETGRRHVLENWTWERAVASVERHLTGTSPLAQEYAGPPLEAAVR